MSIMPLLLNVLQNANGVDYRKLRVKTMEYVVLIGVSLFAVLLLHFQTLTFMIHKKSARSKVTMT